MGFFNPLGFLALLGIPAILIMYMLKEKHKEVKVSSTMLWQKAVLSTLSKKPWQKLRNNILMIIQIIAVILLALALSKPYIIGGDKASHYIIVMDNSSSMGATDLKPTRLDYAKSEAKKLIDNADRDTYFTIISAGKNPVTLLENTQGKDSAKRVLNNIDLTLEKADTYSAVELIKTLKNNNDGNVYIFTDTYFDTEGIADVQVVSVGNSKDNTSIELVSENNGNVMAKVSNVGESDVSKNITLYGDGNILDVQEVSFNGSETKDISFDVDVKDTSVLNVSISPSDNYIYDDEYYYTLSTQTSKNAIMFSDNNIFVEKAVSVLPNINLYKGNNENINDTEGYPLYIYDGVLPEKIPSDGQIIIFSPNENSMLKVLGEVEVNDNVATVNCPITENISSMDFSLSKVKNVEIPSWATVFMKSGDIPVAFYGENNGQKIVVFLFDIHNTDMPLKMEFPILMYNCMKYFFPESSTDIDNIFTGDNLNINLSPDTRESYIIKPSGEQSVVAPPFPADVFSDTNESGIYTLVEKNEQGIENSNLFAVNNTRDFNDDSSQNTNNENVAVKKVANTNKNLCGILIIIIILVLLVEWWVNCREN